MELALKPQPLWPHRGFNCLHPGCTRVGFYGISERCSEHSRTECRCKRRKYNPWKSDRCCECAKEVKRKERSVYGD